MSEPLDFSTTPVVSLVSGDVATLVTDDHNIVMVTATLLDAPDGGEERLSVDRTKVPMGVDVSGIKVVVNELL